MRISKKSAVFVVVVCLFVFFVVFMHTSVI